MTWATPTLDLRNLLSDGDTDKLNYRKRLLPAPNGVITKFKTFENRRVTNFTTAVSPEGVFVNGVAAAVTSDNVSVGEVTITTAPTNNQLVEATYYYRWFIDSELDEFLSNSSLWLGGSGDPLTVAGGLQPAALQYAASEAYQKLSVRWALTYSSNFKLEDQPQKDRQDQVQNPYAILSKECLGKANKLLENFYKRQGQSLAPLFANIPGAVRKVGPNR